MTIFSFAGKIIIYLFFGFALSKYLLVFWIKITSGNVLGWTELKSDYITDVLFFDELSFRIGLWYASLEGGSLL